MRQIRNVLVTGGAGFIGVNLIRFILDQPDFRGLVVNYDKLTYSGNRNSLSDIETLFANRYRFEKGDVTDSQRFLEVVTRYDINLVIHLAAESHVDRSILGPEDFVQTNVVGTFRLLEVLTSFWRDRKDVLFHHVSTDEVFGSLETDGFFTETSPYSPRNPYSASKAASDHFVMSYFHTYGFPVTMTKSGNNYGPYQHPEKLIPLLIGLILEGKTLPVYGDGKNVRDWIHVHDHIRAIWTVITQAPVGSIYNVSGNEPKENLQIVHEVCRAIASERQIPLESTISLIRFVKDRLGHDRKYVIDSSKIQKELNWFPQIPLLSGIKDTVKWYLSNLNWVKNFRSEDYQNWLKKNYQETIE